MKKFATLLVLFSLGLFTVAPMVGCGGDDAGTDDAAAGDDAAGDDAAE